MSQSAVLIRHEPTATAPPAHTANPPEAGSPPHDVANADPEVSLSLTHHAGNTVVVHVRGSLDARTTPRLAALLAPRLECAAPLVVLDLSQVEFVCTVAVGLLMHARLKAGSRGRALRLVGGPRPLERALHAAYRAGAGAFPTYPDVPTALAERATSDVGAKR